MKYRFIEKYILAIDSLDAGFDYLFFTLHKLAFAK